LDATLNRVSARAVFSSAEERIENIAESLTQNAGGTERDLLSKSLQETLLYCVGIDTAVSYSQVKTRLTRFLDRQGAPAVIQLFLSLFFFNYVWFETGESFRAVALSPGEFEKEMESVERICQRIVASTWEAYEVTERPLDSPAAEELIRDIEKRLRGE